MSYKKNQESRWEEENMEIGEFDFHEERNDDLAEDKLSNFISELKEVIARVGKIVELFRKFPVFNNVNLQSLPHFDLYCLQNI